MPVLQLLWYVCLLVCHAAEWVWLIWTDMRSGHSTSYSIAVCRSIMIQFTPFFRRRNTLSACLWRFELDH